MMKMVIKLVIMLVMMLMMMSVMRNLRGLLCLLAFNTSLPHHQNDEDGDDFGNDFGDDVGNDFGDDVGDDVGEDVGDEEFAGPPLPACIQYLSPTSASGPFAITAFHNRWPRFQISFQILIFIMFL